MDKNGQVDAETIFGLILLIVLLITTIYGFLSSNICNRLLIGVGIFGLVWLFFGSPVLTRMETKGFIFFLPLSIVLLIVWIILKATGICTPISEILKNLTPIK